MKATTTSGQFVQLWTMGECHNYPQHIHCIYSASSGGSLEWQLKPCNSHLIVRPSKAVEMDSSSVSDDTDCPSEANYADCPSEAKWYIPP